MKKETILTFLIVVMTMFILTACGSGGGGSTGPDLTTYYLDSDGDGYGDPSDSKEAETQPDGYVLNSEDWDDADITIYPGAEELCDGKDNNQDEGVDEGCETWYRDFDEDEAGNIYNSIEAKTQPDGYVLNNEDWDDDDSTVYPGAPELCDWKDNNQDGEKDENCEPITSYCDNDGDTFGNSECTLEYYYDLPNGYVLDNTDCDDLNINVNPSAAEVWNNGIDDNCDGAEDEGYNDIGQHVITLYATEDTYANSYYPNKTHNEDIIRTGNEDNSGNTTTQYGFAKFDISTISENATIVSATLQLKSILYLVDNGGATTWIYQVTGFDWDENTLNYTNMPTEVARSTSRYIDKEEWKMGSVEWDLKPFVDSWQTSGNNYGIKIRTPHEFLGTFYSSDYGYYSPTLTITYTLP